jgi:Tol biopolymer transport system component
MVVMAADTRQPLYEFDIPYGVQDAKFTPDGKGVAYMLTRKGATNVWLQPLSGGQPRPVTNFTSGDMFAFAWSQDGRQLALSRGRRKSDVVMMSNFR